MGSLKFIDELIEKKLMSLHCGYIGKVLWTDGNTAKVQPLGLMKEYGNMNGVAQPIVDNVPIACQYKITEKTISYIKDTNGTAIEQKIAVPSRIASGDLVVCLCADKDISDARLGKNELPPAGRHSISDSIIVGIL